MSFTFQTDGSGDALQIARVRNHTNDVGNGTESGGAAGVDYFLSNERIALFLTDAASDASSDENRAKLAAAAALDVLATNEAYVQKVQSTLGETTDGAKGADAIRRHAESLRKQVIASEKRVADAAQAEATPGGGFVAQMRRVDGYSAAPCDEYARPNHRCRPC